MLGRVVFSAAALAVATYSGTHAIANYFFKRTILRQNASTERTRKMASTNWEPYIPTIKENSAWLETMKTEHVQIKSNDGLKLKGTLLLSPTAKATVICFHSYTSKGIVDFASLSRFYYNNGYQVLMVDHRAHGDSEGEYIGFGCLERHDALNWVKYVQNRFSPEHSIYLHGLSMGGATVLMASGLDLPRCVKGIISDCAFTSAWQVFENVLKTTYHMPPKPILKSADKICKKRAGYGMAQCNAAVEVQKAKVPILFIHGDADTFVPCSMCYEIYENCNSEKEICIIKGASHAEAYYKDTKTYEEKIIEFISTIKSHF